MKKALKIIGIIFGLFFVLGILAVVFETPEQRAEREAKMAQDKAKYEAEENAKQAELQAKKQVELEDKAKKEAEEKATNHLNVVPTKLPQNTDKQSLTVQANFGMTPQELGSKIDEKITQALGIDVKLGKIQTSGDTFILDLGQGIFWTGNIDKQGKVSASSYRMTIKPNENNDKVFALLILAGVTAQVLHPDIPKEQSAGQVAKMATNATTKATQTKDAVTETMMIGDIKHYTEVYPSTGNIVIGAAHKDQ